MTEKEEQYRKINNNYTNFSYMFYESMRKNGQYSKTDVDRQIDRLIRSLTALKNI